MNVVIDSNVWISSIVFGGNPQALFTQIYHSDHVLIASDELYSEILTVIKRRFPSFEPMFNQLKSKLAKSTKAMPQSEPKITASRDPKDDFLLDLLVASDADMIITGDKDLLVLDPLQSRPIISAAQALKLLL